MEVSELEGGKTGVYCDWQLEYIYFFFYSIDSL